MNNTDSKLLILCLVSNLLEISFLRNFLAEFITAIFIYQVAESVKETIFVSSFFAEELLHKSSCSWIDKGRVRPLIVPNCLPHSIHSCKLLVVFRCDWVLIKYDVIFQNWRKFGRVPYFFSLNFAFVDTSVIKRNKNKSSQNEPSLFGLIKARGIWKSTLPWSQL